MNLENGEDAANLWSGPVLTVDETLWRDRNLRRLLHIGIRKVSDARQIFNLCLRYNKCFPRSNSNCWKISSIR
jgi:hypothetical protein